MEPFTPTSCLYMNEERGNTSLFVDLNINNPTERPKLPHRYITSIDNLLLLFCFFVWRYSSIMIDAKLLFTSDDNGSPSEACIESQTSWWAHSPA